MTNSIPVEHHPLKPFLPPEAHILMLGSFPPQRKRWSMDFYYPNMQNDMWRIFGLIFYSDRDHFVNLKEHCFNRSLIEKFLHKKGIALYDTATSVRRLQDNASDKFLEVVKPTDIAALLRILPLCTKVVTTGEKATETLRSVFHTDKPAVGSFVEFTFEGRPMRLYRMPSSSRAYPLKLEKKAEVYAKLFL